MKRNLRPVIFGFVLMTLAAQAEAAYVCAARPASTPVGELPKVYQRHGFTRLDAERAAVDACRRLSGSTALCVVSRCTYYEE